MQNSSEQLNNNQKKNASKSQKSAAQKMQQMSKDLAQMQQAMEQEQHTEDINKLREILENLIQLSFGQEALMGELSKTNTNDPQFYKINQKQKKLQDDSKMIEDSLLVLSKRVPQIQATVNREISAINMNMEKANDEIKEAQTPSFDGKNHKQEGLSRQQFAMTSVNNLALMLNEALSQMQAESKKKPGPPGSGSCTKPGGTGKKPSMANLRQMQEQLNKQIQKLKEGLEKNGNKPGNKPGDKPGMNGSGMSQELAQLAAQQEAIRQQLQKMADQLDKDGKGGGGVGKLAEKMEETETDLVNKLLSNETLKRQQEILTRLLESEKAEKEREMDEKRQSNEAKNENLSNPNEFLEYNRQKQKETELLKTVPPSLNPFFKLKVNQYFNKFEE
jgi:DNA repair exonuclease SbcCD ATPase subunit